MTDIASLGLSVDSKQVEQARETLGRFASSAKTAQAAASNFSRSATRDFDTSGKKAEAAGVKLREFVQVYDKSINGKASGEGRNGRQQDLEAWSKQLDDMRAKFNPLYAAEKKHLNLVQSINAAQAFGAISQTEASLAVLAAKKEYDSTSAAISHNNAQLLSSAKSAGMSAAAMTNLGFQINDVATQAALGQDPLRILAAQGGQFYQVLTQSGSLKGSLTHIGSLIKGWITPLRLATGGAVGLSSAAVMAASAWRSAQHDINLALIGTGGVAGMTTESINKITLAAAHAGTATVGDAREMALGFAATGNIAGDLTEQLIGMSKGFGALYGETATEGAARLSRIFTDPAKGVDELNKRLSVFDAATVDSVKSMSEQGRRLETQTMLVDGMRLATQQAALETTGWGNAWTRLTTKTSEYWAIAGRALDGATGGGNNSLEAQLADAQARLEAAKGGRTLRSGGKSVDAASVRDEAAAVERLTQDLAKLNQAIAEAPGNSRSIDYTAAVNAALPDMQALKDATNALENLRKAQMDPAGMSGMPKQQQAGLEKAVAMRREEVASITQKIAAQMTSLDIAKQDNAFAMLGIEARSAAERAQVAYMQTAAREKRAGNVNYEYVAQAAKAQVLAEAERSVGDEIRQRNFTAQQSIDLANLELSLVGKTADEAARVTAAFQARQQVQADAFSSFRTASPSELKSAADFATKKADIESRIKREQLRADIDFERSQMGRSETEQAVYARLQSAGLLDHGQIVGAKNEEIAAQMRLNEQLQRSMDIQKEFASGYLHDIMAGKSATEALGSALDNLASRTLDNSLNLLFSGISGLGGTPTGGLLRGNILPGIFHAGGTVGNDNAPTRSVPASVFANAKRYHSGGVIGADERPAILQVGEQVLSRKQVAAGAGGGGGVVIHMPVTLNAQGAYPESIAEITARLNEMPGKVIKAVNNVRSRGIA